jgi:hypothetical protein
LFREVLHQQRSAAQQMVASWNRSADDADALVDALLRLNSDGRGIHMTGAHIDQLLFITQGVVTAIQHFKWFDLLDRTFHRFVQLVDAVRIADDSRCHLDADTEHRVVGYLTAPTCVLFTRPADLKLQFTGVQLDQLVIEGGGLTALFSHLHRLQEQGRRFNSVTELAHAVVALHSFSAHTRRTTTAPARAVLHWSCRRRSLLSAQQHTQEHCSSTQRAHRALSLSSSSSPFS